jgi:hypothetical protein
MRLGAVTCLEMIEIFESVVAATFLRRSGEAIILACGEAEAAASALE